MKTNNPTAPAALAALIGTAALYATAAALLALIFNL
jgi:hypothetical protein